MLAGMLVTVSEATHRALTIGVARSIVLLALWTCRVFVPPQVLV